MLLNIVCHLYVKRLSITAYFFKCSSGLILKVIHDHHRESVKKIKMSHSLTTQCKLGETAQGLSSGKGRNLFQHVRSTF